MRDHWSVSPRVFIILENLGLGGDNFSIILLLSIWFSAINVPEIAILFPLAPHIPIIGYTHEYRDDRWSEGLAARMCSYSVLGILLQVSTPSPLQYMGPPRASGTLQGTVVCVVFVFGVSDFPHQGL